MKRVLTMLLLGLALAGCSSGVIKKGEERNIITYLMNRGEVIELLGEPAKVIHIKGSDAYRAEGCPGDSLEVLQYESPGADRYSLFVINQQGVVCKKLEKQQKALWANQ